MGLYYMSEIVNVREKVKTVKAVEYRSTNPCFPSGKWEIRGLGASHVRTNSCRQNRVSQGVTAIKDQARRLLAFYGKPARSPLLRSSPSLTPPHHRVRLPSIGAKCPTWFCCPTASASSAAATTTRPASSTTGWRRSERRRGGRPQSPFGS